MVVTFLINFFVLGTAALLTARYYRLESILYRLLAVAVFFYAQIILIEIAWGVLGKLSLYTLVPSVGVIFLVCFLSFRSKFKNVFGFPQEITKHKIVIFCLSVIAGFSLVKLSINLVNPPFGWDSLNYHFS